MARFFEVLNAAAASLDLAMKIAQFLEQLIPDKGKGIIKKELGMDLMKRAKEDIPDPDSLALDMAVAKLKANGWEQPGA